MTVLLVVDLLGTRDVLRAGGPQALDRHFRAFHELVGGAARDHDAGRDLIGELDGDCATISCPSPEAALSLGRRIFRRAWFDARTPEDPRTWLRGAIVDEGDDGDPVREEPIEGLPDVARVFHSAPALESFAALRSGFRGMRLLVQDRLLSDPLRGLFRIPLGRLGVIPFRRMNFTPYPGLLQRGWQDFLWMAEVEPEWQQYVTRMKQRLLWSSRNDEETAQAAATQVVFHECDAIVQSVVRKNRTQRWHDDEEHVAGHDRTDDRADGGDEPNGSATARESEARAPVSDEPQR